MKYRIMKAVAVSSADLSLSPLWVVTTGGRMVGAGTTHAQAVMVMTIDVATRRRAAWLAAENRTRDLVAGPLTARELTVYTPNYP